MLMVNMKEYMTSGHIWNDYKLHIISFLNYDYSLQSILGFHGMTSDHTSHPGVLVAKIRFTKSGISAKFSYLKEYKESFKHQYDSKS